MSKPLYASNSVPTIEFLSGRQIQLQDKTCPNQENQKTCIRLGPGFKIKVSTFYNASIPPERKEEAYEWLDTNGHGGMIKTEVKTNFGRGELEAAKALIAEINENHPEIAMDLNQTVHWQTLRAWVKEQVEGGKSLPIDMFGVFVGRKTKITLAASKTR